MCKLAGISIALWACASCATLEEVVSGCGNHVVEGGEDCDAVAEGGEYLCGDPDTQHQCRFVWQDDPSVCPTGYVASPDKRCRFPSGVLVDNGVSFDMPGGNPQVGDFTGDGTTELGLIEPSSDLALYALSNSASERIVTLPTFGVVALGELSSDASTDIIYGTQPLLDSADTCTGAGPDGFAQKSTNGGLSVLRSNEGSFDLKFYANSTYGQAVRFSAMPPWVFGDCLVLDLDVLARIDVIGQTLEICAIDDCQNTKAILPDVSPMDTLSMDSSDAYVVASAVNRSNVLYVARNGFTTLSAAFANPQFLPLEGGATLVGNVQLADVDVDGFDDLVVVGYDPDDGDNPYWLYVLRGRAAGLGETYPALGTVLDSTLRPWLPLGAFVPPETPFAVAQLNADLVPDLFVGDRVLVSKGVPLAPPPPPEIPPVPIDLADFYRTDFWYSTQVAVGDLNGDGRDDLVGQGAGIQVVLGGELLPLVKVDLLSEALGPGTLTQVAVSDFDGDGADDILGAFVSLKDAGPGTTPSGASDAPDPCSKTESLIVAYGRVGGHPETPTTVASLPQIKQIAAGRFEQPADGFGDFAVAAACGSSATLLGDPYRRVRSPFLFDNGPDSSFDPGEVVVRDVVLLADLDVDETGAAQGHDDVVVAGQLSMSGALTGEGNVLLLPSWADAELDLSRARQLTAPEKWRLGDGETSTRQVIGLEASHNVVAMAGLITASEGNTQQIEGDWVIQPVPDDGEPGSAASFSLAPIAIDADMYLNHSFARLAVAKLNADDIPDFALVYGGVLESSGPVGDMGNNVYASGVVKGALVLALSSDGSYQFSNVAGFGDVSGDQPVDVVVLGDQLAVVGQTLFYQVDVPSRTATFSAALGLGPTLMSEAAVGDFSGDGLDDVIVFDGARSYLLEQLPLNP